MTVNQLSDKLALSRLYDRGEDDIMVSLGNSKYAHIVDVVPFKTTVVIQIEKNYEKTNPNPCPACPDADGVQKAYAGGKTTDTREITENR